MYSSVRLRWLKVIWTLYFLFMKLALSKNYSQDYPRSPSDLPPYPTCGTCYCIPEEGENCPSPETVTDSFRIKGAQMKLVSQEALNPYTLDCNPFTDLQCKTTPEQKFLELGEDAVCGIHYKVLNRFCPKEYMLQSYPSRIEAEADGAIVTHVGACGLCSTTKDLSALMTTKELGPVLSVCAFRFGLSGLSMNNMIQCVQKLGLTSQCAKIIAMNAIASFDLCNKRCQQSVLSGEPTQFGLPDCSLGDCLSCNNEFAYPTFLKFAGRDHHRSGILAGYTRPCSLYVNITHDPCPDYKSLIVTPTAFKTEPLTTKSAFPSITVTTSSSSSTPKLRGLFVAFMMVTIFVFTW